MTRSAGRWLTTSLVVAITLTLLIATPAAASVGSASVDPKGVLRVGIDLTSSNSTPFSADPALSNGSPIATQWMNLIYDNLVRFDTAGRPVPGLATAWKVVDDHTIDLVLRSGVKFQDGTAFDAAAVKYSLERTLAAAPKNPSLSKDFTQLVSVDVINPLNVRLNLNSATASTFFPQLGQPPTMVVSPTAAQREGNDFAQNPVGAGPYRVTEFDTNKMISVRKFSKSWDAKTWRLGGVDWLQLQAGPPQVTAIAASQIDVVSPTTTQLAQQLQAQPSISVLRRASDNSVMHLDLCTNRAPFNNVKVRQAVAYAINRAELNTAVANGNGVVTDQPWPVSSANYSATAAHYPHNIAKAKKLLKEAGVAPDTEFELATPAVPAFQDLAAILQQQLGAIGLKVKLVSSVNYVQDVLVDKKYAATLVQTVQPGLKLLTPVTPGSLSNFCDYNNNTINQAMNVLGSSIDTRAQTDAWHTIANQLGAEVPMQYLYFVPVYVAFNPSKVGGITPGSLYGTPGAVLDFHPVYIKK